MKTVGYLMITIGFLAGSLTAVQTAKNEVNWGWYLPVLILGAVGVSLARFGQQLRSRDQGTLRADIENVTSSIHRIVERIGQLNDQKGQIHPCDLHGRIDDLFPEDLATFVDARESIGHVYGLPAYADVMNEFAAGERYLNRVWSASVDGYVDDAHEYLERAMHQFETAQRKLIRLREHEGRMDAG